jgi:hypothetical protein
MLLEMTNALAYNTGVLLISLKTFIVLDPWIERYLNYFILFLIVEQNLGLKTFNFVRNFRMRPKS